MYSTGRVSLEAQQGKKEGGEKTDQWEGLHSPHKTGTGSAMQLLSPTPARSKCVGAGGIKKGLSFPVPTSFLSRGYKKCLFAGLSFGNGEKHYPLCNTRDRSLDLLHSLAYTKLSAEKNPGHNILGDVLFPVKWQKEVFGYNFEL